MYFEETDLCSRIRREGYEVVSVPEAKIIHLEGKSFGEGMLNKTKLGFYESSRLTYYRRNLTPKTVELAQKIYFHNLRRKASAKGLKGEIARMRLELARSLSPEF